MSQPPSSGQSPSPATTYTTDGRRILFYAKALYDYIPTIDEEFDFRAGDLIAVTDTPDDGWWRGELVDDERRQPGRHVFPSNYVSLSGKQRVSSGKDTDEDRPILFYVKALYDYDATTDEEFHFKQGDLIAVTDPSEDGWWRGELVNDERRQPGRHVFPSNFVSAACEKPGSVTRPTRLRPTRTCTDDGRTILFYVEALFDYHATIYDEFDFLAGDLIAVTDAPGDGWWHGELEDETRRETGRDTFPSNFVILV